MEILSLDNRKTSMNADALSMVLFTTICCVLVPAHRFFPIGQIDENGVAGLDQVLGRDHDLLSPLPRARAEDRFLYETRLEEGPESGRLPAEGGNGADHVAGRCLDDFRISHPDVARADRFLEMSRDGRLIASKHHEHTFAGIRLKDQGLDRLSL